MKTLKSAGLEVERGKRKKRNVKIGELVNCSEVSVPFIVVNGVEDGPILVLRGGEHGSEYCGQEIVRRAGLGVDPEKLSGAIIAVPNCNPLAYLNGDYTNTKVYDTSMGAQLPYPGDPKGTFDDRVGNLIWEEALSKADVTITMHDGATHWIARYIASVFYTPDKKDLGQRALALAKAFGVGMPVQYAEVREYPYPPGPELAKRNVPSMTPELGGMRMIWKEDVERGVKGITNVLKHLNMIDGEPEPSKQAIFKEYAWIRCNHGGVLIPAFSPLDIPLTVEKGDTLATITNMLSDEVEVIESPFNAVVFMARANCAAHTGDALYGVGKIE